nr:MFS transporter [Mycolicibacterium sp. CBMA 361]
MTMAHGRASDDSDPVTLTATTAPSRTAWTVAAVSFLAILAAAGFRAVPGVLMDPLHHEFGWSHATVGLAMSVNMTLFGVTAPFAAALMDKFGVRPVLTVALGLITAGSALSVRMTTGWQLVACWGVLIGLGTGCISMGFVATVATRWFDERRGLVTGLTVVAPVLVVMRHHPPTQVLTAPTDGFRSALSGLVIGARVPVFWLLAGSFAICGMTTNGLIGTHFIPAAHDHGMPTTLAAGLLATIGVLDVAGTVFSGWLTDRVDPRLLLTVYYVGRGISLTLLPSLLSPHANPSTWVFIVFYGLDWVATVPPTIALCRDYFGDRSPVVFGWVFAAHQVGAAVAAAAAGWLRDLQGSYDLAFQLAAGLCAVAAILCFSVRKVQVRTV